MQPTKYTYSAFFFKRLLSCNHANRSRGSPNVLPLSKIFLLRSACAPVIWPLETSPLLAPSIRSGGLMPAGQFSVHNPQVVQVFKLSRTSESTCRPEEMPFITIMRPLVLADSQPDSSKTGQKVRHVPQRTH